MNTSALTPPSIHSQLLCPLSHLRLPHSRSPRCRALSGSVMCAAACPCALAAALCRPALLTPPAVSLSNPVRRLRSDARDVRTARRRRRRRASLRSLHRAGRRQAPLRWHCNRHHARGKQTRRRFHDGSHSHDDHWQHVTRHQCRRHRRRGWHRRHQHHRRRRRVPTRHSRPIASPTHPLSTPIPTRQNVRRHEQRSSMRNNGEHTLSMRNSEEHAVRSVWMKPYLV